MQDGLMNFVVFLLGRRPQVIENPINNKVNPEELLFLRILLYQLIICLKLKERRSFNQNKLSVSIQFFSAADFTSH